MAAGVAGVLLARTRMSPCKTQPSVPVSKSGFVTELCRRPIHLDVVHQAFAHIEQADLRVGNRRSVVWPVVQHAGGFDVGPTDFGVSSLSAQLAASRLLAFGSISSRLLPAAGRPLAPAPAGAIRDIIHRSMLIMLVTGHALPLVACAPPASVSARCSPFVESLPAEIAQAVR